MKHIQRFLFLDILVIVIAYGNASAQKDQRFASSEETFRTNSSAEMSDAAHTRKIKLMQGAIAYAGSEDGFVVNTAIEGAEHFESKNAATDLLFVYVGESNLVLSQGYYTVRLSGEQAQFIGSDGKRAATLQVKISGVFSPKKEQHDIKVTASIEENGPIVGIEIPLAKQTEPPLKRYYLIRIPRHDYPIGLPD